jgi:hypothetical protein
MMGELYLVQQAGAATSRNADEKSFLPILQYYNAVDNLPTRMRYMKLWKDTKRPQAQELISWLLSSSSGDGWPVDYVNIITFAELIDRSIKY